MIGIETLLIAFCLFGWIVVLIYGLFIKRGLTWICYGAVFIHLFIIVFRLISAGHLPFANIYESLIFFAFLYGIKFTLMRRTREEISSLVILPTIFLLGVALLMPSSEKNPSELGPVLKSVWFYIHIPSIFLGYVSILFAFVLSFFQKDKTWEMMENEVKTGFFFLSAGIIFGAFWGHQSWSRFWNWDPKEVWALVTWLLLAAVLHVKNRKVKRVFLYLSFAALLFTYFGVTYILPGLHSYR